MPAQLTLETIIYWLALAVVVVAEHALLSERWRKAELARRTLGIATVLGGALPLIALGQLDWWTWTVLLCGFGLAGAITGALYTQRWASHNQHRLSAIRANAEKIIGSLNGGDTGETEQ